MLPIILAGFLGLAAGFGTCWLIVRKLPQERIREINQANIKAEEQSLRELEQRKHQLQIEHQNDLLTNNKEIDEVMMKLSLLKSDLNHLKDQKIDLNKNLEESKRNAERTAKTFLTQQLELASEQLDRSLERVAAQYQEEEEMYKSNYLLVMRECANQFLKDIENLQSMSNEAQSYLDDLQSKVDAAVAAAKREEEKRQEKNFYRLILPDSDLNEISQLRAVEPYLRDREALNKVIWKVYYEKPYTDLIGRVIGNAAKTGIYKITNMQNQMCYIGQAANVADRWRQHIKRGLGAETPTRNKLYPAMAEYGVENFTFELVEECSRDDLDEREDFWQDYFKAKEFGYSIK